MEDKTSQVCRPLGVMVATPVDNRAGRTCASTLADKEVATLDSYTTPILTARETARYLSMPESTLDRWLVADAALVHSVVPARRGGPRIPFVGVVEAHVLRALRQLGLSMFDIRVAALRAREALHDDYALASQRIATDGVSLFLKLADDNVIHAATGQLAMREVLDDSLRYIQWDRDGRAQTLRLKDFPASADVIIDPRFGWGAPVLGRSKVRVSDVVDLWRAGEPITAVAAEYGLDVNVVEDVLRRAA